MKLGVLFSGGKDSTYAMYLAAKHHEISCLLTMHSKNEESFMFHTPNTHLTELQAESLGIPLLSSVTTGEKEKELIDLHKLIQKAKQVFQIDGIVTGAIESVYQASRIQKICDRLGLWCFNPLWQKKQEEEMREILKNKFKFMITKIAALGLNENWLGKIINEKDIDALAELNKKFGLNVSFEGGEAETLMLDGPCFRKKLIIKEAEKVMQNDFTGIYEIKRVELV